MQGAAYDYLDLAVEFPLPFPSHRPNSRPFRDIQLEQRHRRIVLSFPSCRMPCQMRPGQAPGPTTCMYLSASEGTLLGLVGLCFFFFFFFSQRASAGSAKLRVGQFTHGSTLIQWKRCGCQLGRGIYIHIYISLHFLRLHKALWRYVERYTSGSPFRQGLGLVAYDSDQAVGDRKLADIL